MVTRDVLNIHIRFGRYYILSNIQLQVILYLYCLSFMIFYTMCEIFFCLPTIVEYAMMFLIPLATVSLGQGIFFIFEEISLLAIKI